MVAPTRIREDEGDDGSADPRAWWSNSKRLAVAKVLLEAGRPLTPGEIAARLRGDQSNVRRTAEQMVEAGILVHDRPERRSKGRGRQPGIAYWLATTEIAPLRAHLAHGDRHPAILREGLQLLTVSVPEDLQRRFRAIVIEQKGKPGGPDWVTTLDGSGQRHWMGFEGREALKDAERLRGILVQNEIECTRSTLTELASGEEFIDDSSEWLEAVNGVSEKLEQLERTWPP